MNTSRALNDADEDNPNDPRMKDLHFLTRTEDSNQTEIEKMMRFVIKEMICVNDVDLKQNENIQMHFANHLNSMQEAFSDNEILTHFL